MGLFGRDDQPLETKPDDGRQPSRPAAPPRLLEPRKDRDFPEDQDRRTLSGSGEIVVNGYVYGSIEVRRQDSSGGKGPGRGIGPRPPVVVAGTGDRQRYGRRKIELEQSAQVDGDITAPRILIHDGASFRGQVNMRKPPAAAGPPTSSARRESPGKTKG